jgi:hypothetical protein
MTKGGDKREGDPENRTKRRAKEKEEMGEKKTSGGRVGAFPRTRFESPSSAGAFRAEREPMYALLFPAQLLFLGGPIMTACS